ncbi:PREDICTED: transient receptor potential cation channel subfamily A member 1 homolog isoform X2 [Acropora digitifera]|uniref:transient receptor potential cation channel subfamily A member 1 homolog isoform X2 n=1 Tax=Acropora digitifera TaxID=70779 RepID=UPI00077ABFDD|nr:PREDICTED: transient receptor potential cation channel subfamily A member 1 homolog isoform X2 [Acropora digitifera]
MTQVGPEPALSAKPNQDESQVPEIEDVSHITLHQAARDGKADVIEHKVQNFGGNKARLLNKGDEANNTPLHCAVRYGHVNVVKLLSEFGADISKPGEYGASPLHYAARFRDTNTVRQPGSRYSSNDDLADVEISAAHAPVTTALSTDKIGGDVNLSHEMQVSTEDSTESLIMFLVQQGGDVNVCDNYGLSPLHYAASKGNLTAVRELLQCDGIKIDQKDASRSTPLHCAAADGAVEVVKALLDAGADVTARDNEERTPIHLACTDNKIDTVQVLFEHVENSENGYDISDMLEGKNKEGETALHAAVKGGCLDIVKLCLDKGAKVRARRGNLAHPLHIAAINGHVKIAACLIEHNANIEARNALHETPLHKAAASNKREMVEFLLEKGADIECLDKDKYTPLLIAASRGHTAVVELLLKRDAKLRVRNTQDRTAIFLAAEDNSIDTLMEILQYEDAKNLLNESDLDENTPLHVAAKNGFAIIVEALLSNGARINPRNEDERTPLHLATENGKVRTVTALVREDPSVINDEDEESNTPLHLAATKGHLKCCKALLENGADVEARNSTLWTPIDCAAAKGHAKVAGVLLEFDSPVDPMDKTKTTPLHLAAREGHPEVVSLLLSKGADITLTDHSGRNCLDLAVDYGRKESAITIINDENWRKVMQNKSWEQDRLTTPMRKLITKLPEVAGVVFNRCVKENDRRFDDPDYEITLDYEFLEDIYSDWSENGDGIASETSSQMNFYMDGIPEEDESKRIRGKVGAEEAVQQLEREENHPLMIMVENKRQQLLSHPLVTFLLHYKWQKFGRRIYYFKLALFCVFLFFLTEYTIYSTQLNKLSEDMLNKSSFPYVLWIDIGSFVTLALALAHIGFELFQLGHQFKQYFSWGNLLEWAVYILALVYVADEFNVSVVNKFRSDKAIFGALSIFFSWMSLALFIRKFPKLGIYVVMFTSIFYTFMKFFIIYVLFIVAFGLAFYTLLDTKQPGFSSPGRSCVKTAVMMIGEFDFDDTFNSDVTVPGVTWFLFIVFLIVMTLLLMNLLIGLAVDDIHGVQEQAFLEQQAMVVNLSMDIEKALPKDKRKKWLPVKEKVRPNQYGRLEGLWNGAPISAEDIKAALKPKKTPMEGLNHRTEQLQETVEGLKNRLTTVQFNLEELHKMLGGVVKKLEAVVEGDDNDDNQLF